MSRLVRSKPLELRRGVLYWVYTWAHSNYANKHYGYEPWEALEEKCLWVGFAPWDYGWCKRTVIVYDGIEIRAWSFLGLAVGWSYTWQAFPLPKPSRLQPLPDNAFEDTVWPFDEEPH